MTTIPVESLAERLAALEDVIGILLAPPDTIQPNYLTVNPDGTVGAAFTGLVHAEGLDLDAATASSPPDQNLIRWLRTSDGTPIAEVQGIIVGPPGAAAVSSELNATGPEPGDNAQVDLLAVDQAGFTDLVVNSTGAVTITSLGHLVTLFDGNRRSSFFQLGADILSGVAFGTLSWPGGDYDSTTTTFSAPGCSGIVRGVMVTDALSNGAGIAAPRCQAITAGELLLQATQVNRAIGTPAAGTTIDYTLMWWGT